MKKLNKQGFSVVEGLLIFAIVGILSFVGWYVYRQSQKQDETSKPQNSANSAPVQEKTINFVPPNDFTDEEVKEITEKVAGPFVYYESKVLNNDPVVVTIKKDKNSGNVEAGYGYIFNYKSKGDLSGRSGWLFGEMGKILYWTPQLCDDGGCSEYPADFKEKYPKNYEAYMCSQDTSKSKDELSQCGY